jgi:phosphoribosylaminoimidazole-succinocarboxamide synthase
MGKEGQVVPEMTADWIQIISNRYIELYEKITGTKFNPQDLSDKETYELTVNALNSL